MFHGSIVALVTPMQQHTVDEGALKKLIHYHLERGTSAVVAVGTTGEASTLDKREYRRVIEIAAHESGGQIPVIAGAGSNSPTDAIAYADIAATAGANAVLQVMGYYNRPNQEGIFQHFRLLSQTTRLPIIVYNVPPRTIIDIKPETMARIAALEHVVGVKDATCDLSRPLQERLLIANKSFCLLSGEDPTAVAYNAHGGSGCISVTANVAPVLCSQLQQHCASGDYSAALNIQLQLLPLHQALFLEPSPAGVKYAASLLGLCKDTCRLPLVPLTETTKTRISQAMKDLELI